MSSVFRLCKFDLAINTDVAFFTLYEGSKPKLKRQILKEIRNFQRKETSHSFACGDFFSNGVQGKHLGVHYLNPNLLV